MVFVCLFLLFLISVSCLYCAPCGDRAGVGVKCSSTPCCLSLLTLAATNCLSLKLLVFVCLFFFFLVRCLYWCSSPPCYFSSLSPYCCQLPWSNLVGLCLFLVFCFWCVPAATPTMVVVIIMRVLMLVLTSSVLNVFVVTVLLPTVLVSSCWSLFVFFCFFMCIFY